MPPSAVYLQIVPDGAIHKSLLQHGLSSKTRPASQGEISARVSSRVTFLYLKRKQPNLAFDSLTRLTSSSALALSLVQRSFFCGDVIAITSWAPLVSFPAGNNLRKIRLVTLHAFLGLLHTSAGIERGRRCPYMDVLTSTWLRLSPIIIIIIIIIIVNFTAI